MMKRIGIELVNIEIGMIVKTGNGSRFLVIDTGSYEGTNITCVNIGTVDYEVLRVELNDIVSVYSVNVSGELHDLMSGRVNGAYEDTKMLWTSNKIPLTPSVMAVMPRDTVLMYKGEPHHFDTCGPSETTLYLFKDGRSSKTSRGALDSIGIDIKDVTIDPVVAAAYEPEKPNVSLPTYGRNGEEGTKLVDGRYVLGRRLTYTEPTPKCPPTGTVVILRNRLYKIVGPGKHVRTAVISDINDDSRRNTVPINALSLFIGDAGVFDPNSDGDHNENN